MCCADELSQHLLQLSDKLVHSNIAVTCKRWNVVGICPPLTWTSAESHRHILQALDAVNSQNHHDQSKVFWVCQFGHSRHRSQAVIPRCTLICAKCRLPAMIAYTLSVIAFSTNFRQLESSAGGKNCTTSLCIFSSKAHQKSQFCTNIINRLTESG